MGKNPLPLNAIPEWMGRAVMGAVLLAVWGYAAPVQAQEKKPRLLLGENPEKYSEPKSVILLRSAEPKKSILWLRPNTEVQLFPYVDNPTEEDMTFVVQVLNNAGSAMEGA